MDYNYSSFSSFGNINSYSLPISSEEEKPKPEEYSDEELEEIKKQSINSFTAKKNHLAFLSLCNLNKENDIKPDKPLERMEVLEGEYIKFYTGTDPFDTGRRLYNSANVVIAPNIINALIGCNGAGKSTLRIMIKDIVDSNHFPCLVYNNEKDGGGYALESMAFDNDFSGLSFGLTSSEGENICNNVFTFLTPVQAILEGKVTRDTRFKQYRNTDHVFLILDAVDSGFSIDNIINLKSYLNKLIELAKENNKFLYIIVAANSFEFAVDTRSWDVQRSKEAFYTKDDYVKYRERIVETRNRILSQWEKLEQKISKPEEDVVETRAEQKRKEWERRKK